jgi:hypothetical protein
LALKRIKVNFDKGVRLRHDFKDYKWKTKKQVFEGGATNPK